MAEPLRLTFAVDCPAEHAFAVWTTGIARWWPADHTVTGEAGLDVEHRAAALCRRLRQGRIGRW